VIWTKADILEESALNEGCAVVNTTQMWNNYARRVGIIHGGDRLARQKRCVERGAHGADVVRVMQARMRSVSTANLSEEKESNGLEKHSTNDNE